VVEILFAYLAGLLTLINPCVLPVLPIVLATALGADRRGPMALALGMSIAFVGFGMFVNTIGFAIGLTIDRMSQIGAVLMIVFGLVLLIPQLSAVFERATARMSARANAGLDGASQQNLRTQFLGGLLLGLVWAPCIGPTLGAAIALASQGESLFWVFLIMCAFAAGVSTLILGIGIGGQTVLRERAMRLRGFAHKRKRILGVAFLIVGLMILFKVHHIFERWALGILPYWLQDLSVMF